MPSVSELKRGLLHWVCQRSDRIYRQTFEAVTPSARPPGAPYFALTYAGHRQLGEVVASIRSLVRTAGQPAQIVVASDGTLTDDDGTTLRRVNAATEVVDALDRAHDLPGELSQYARTSPYGRKLLSIAFVATGTELPLLYFDSDVLFGLAASDLPRLLVTHTTPAAMSEPNKDAFDPRADLRDEDKTNSGFLFLPEPISWTRALAPYTELMTDTVKYTEQTIISMVVRDHTGSHLDPRRFVLDYRDARSMRDIGTAEAVVARHYVAPIRWKFWIRVGGGWPRSLASLASGRWLGPV